MNKELTYSDCLRLQGLDCVYTNTDGEALLKVREEVFAVGTSNVDKAMKEAAVVFEKRGLTVASNVDGELKGHLVTIFPELLKEEHAYILCLVAENGKRFIISAGFKPEPWPDHVTKDMDKMDYFQARLMDGKSAVYHYRNGQCRLTLGGEVWDCGTYDHGSLHRGSGKVTWEEPVAGETSIHEGCIRGRLHLKTHGDTYALAMLGFGGEIILVYGANLLKELDSLG